MRQFYPVSSALLDLFHLFVLVLPATRGWTRPATSRCPRLLAHGSSALGKEHPEHAVSSLFTTTSSSPSFGGSLAHPGLTPPGIPAEPKCLPIVHYPVPAGMPATLARNNASYRTIPGKQSAASDTPEMDVRTLRNSHANVLQLRLLEQHNHLTQPRASDNHSCWWVRSVCTEAARSPDSPPTSRR